MIYLYENIDNKYRSGIRILIAITIVSYTISNCADFWARIRGLYCELSIDVLFDHARTVLQPQ